VSTIMQPRAITGRKGVAGIARRCVAGLAAALQVAIGAAAPAGSATGDVYTCTYDGKVTKSDHEIAGCQGVQTRTNQAGVATRLLTPDQVTAVDQCEKDKGELITKWRTTDRYNKNLLGKYPDIAALRLARNGDLASARESVARSQARLVELDKERKRLADERMFYPNGNLPPRLQRAIDDNDALIAAQQQGLKTAQDDVARIGSNFDDLEKYMTILWLGRAIPMPGADCSPEKLFGKAPRK
jgi:hypothetical protein